MNRLRLADPRSLKARDALGRYELVRELAFGRSYSVYLARAPGDAQSVVIKRLRSAHPEPHARARMLREARVGLGMRVPQLVRVLEIHDEPELFLVMEYVEGAPLSELLARARGKDVLRCVVPVLLDALRALSSLHGWRDETGAPGYLVHQAPSARHLLVGLDGVTRLIDLSNLYGRILGAMPSAQYTLMDSELAPEQAARVPLDPRCDLYIVGSVLRHALAQSGRANLPGLLEVSERSTALRPVERYWSADEMAHALHFAASEADLLASPEEVGRWVRLSRASLIAPTATSPRVRPMLPAPSPMLSQLVLPTPSPTWLPTPGVHTTVIEVMERVEAQPPPTEPAPGAAPLAERAAEVLATPRRSPPSLRPRLSLLAAGLALAVGAGAGVRAWLNREPAVVATPLAFSEPAPARPVLVAQVPLVEEVTPPAPAPVVQPPADPAPKRERRPKRTRLGDAPKPAPAAALERELVLHEPEVLFYDEEDPAAPPRIGVPINPF